MSVNPAITRLRQSSALLPLIARARMLAGVPAVTPASPQTIAEMRLRKQHQDRETRLRREWADAEQRRKTEEADASQDNWTFFLIMAVLVAGFRSGDQFRPEMAI